MKEKLKTLKDLKYQDHPANNDISIQMVKALTIKWVKSDLKDWNSISKDVLLKRWMKRLDITSEDLK